MKQPTHYYIEYQGLPGALIWEVPLGWSEYLKTIDKQLVKASGVDNMISVIQQSYDKNCAPDEKDKLTLLEPNYEGTYIFKVLNWEVLTLKEAFYE